MTADDDTVHNDLSWRAKRPIDLSICSAHIGKPRDDCRMCRTDIRDVIPNYDDLIAQAERAGRHACECGFVYYKTVNTCPLCGG